MKKYACGRTDIKRYGLAIIVTAILCGQIAFAGDVSLAWDANTQPMLAGYQLFYGTASRQYGNPIDVGTATSYTLRNLSEGTYYFSVKSYGSGGLISTYSNEVTAVVLPPPDTTPPTISNVGSLVLSSTAARISWVTNEVSDSVVQFGLTGTYGSTISLGPLVTTHAMDLNGLVPGTTYHYRVISRDAAGNAGTSNDFIFTTFAPADTTPPTISGATSSNITSSTATIAWMTNEAADTQVDYGTTAGYGNSTTLSSTLTTVHTQGLSGLAASTHYHYRLRSRDAAGNLATSGDYTFTTLAPPDTTPPTISGVTSSNITSSTAIIAWTTNETADTQVDYGTTASYGNSTTLNGTLTTVHTQGLSGLTASTTYHYRVISKDAAGNNAVSGDNTFITLAPPDKTPPAITNIRTSSVSSTTATIQWTTDEVADSQVEYGTTSGYGTFSAPNSALVTAHAMGLNGLVANTTYHYRVISKDAAGNLGASGDNTFTTSAAPDTTPPVISNIRTSNVGSTTATILWNTDEAADSRVEYGITTGYTNQAIVDNTLVTSHTIGLNGLMAGTTYHYRVVSKDAAGNPTTSGDNTFTTSAAPDTIPPVISNVLTSNVGSTTATILWKTDEAADSQVEYGTTTGYGTLTALNSVLVASHSQDLTGLTAGTTYHYRVISKDAAGNSATSSDATLVTQSGIDLSAGLVAAYGFDEGSGSVSGDGSSTGGTASIYSAQWVSGVFGSALSFDGKNSYVTATASVLPDMNQPKTIAFWINMNNKNGLMQTFVSLFNSKAQSALLNGLKGTAIGALNQNQSWLVASAVPSLKAWHHIAYTFDGSQNILYVDGRLISSSTIANAAAPVTSFEIGRGIDNSRYFKGSIDELRIYNRALNASEINAVMDTPIAVLQTYSLSTGVSASSASLADPIALSEEGEDILTSAPGASVDLQLNSSTYSPGEMIYIDSFRISNASDASGKVEIKNWMELPNMNPISLTDPNSNGYMEVTPWLDLDSGREFLMKISSNSPMAIGQVNARLLDPITGMNVSEDQNPFAIMAKRKGGGKSQVLASAEGQASIVIEKRLVDSRIQYYIMNTGAISGPVEIKIWLQNDSTGSSVPVLSLGTDGSLVLPGGSMLLLDPQAAWQSPPVGYVLKAKMLNHITGAILAEQ